MRATSESRGVFPILVLALLVRVLTGLPAVPDSSRLFTPDGQQYIALARDLRSGYLDPQSALWPVGLLRTPPYPLFSGILIAAGRGSVGPVIAAQIAIGVLAVALAYLLAARLFGPRAGRLGALVLALDPATAIYTNLLQPETLFTTLVLASVLLWLSVLETGDGRSAALAGAFAGLAALTRPIGLFLPIPLLAVAATCRPPRRSRLPAAVIMLAAFAIPVGGWMARNFAFTGQPILSTIGGTNLLDYRAAGALALENGTDIEPERAKLARELERRGETAGGPATYSRAQSKLAVEVLMAHPLAVARSAAAGLLRLTTGTGMTALSGLRGDPEPEEIRGRREWSLQFSLTGLLALSYLGALCGVATLRARKDRRSLIVLGSFILYFALISAGPEATTRFRVPTMPFIAALAGLGFAHPPWKRAPPESPVAEE